VLFDGGYFAGELNTMVVVLNYRLAALGFLYAPESWGNSNVGLADQRFAIQWTHDNAAYFNADPGKVAIAGQSAGGESVLIHLTNPKNPIAGYFSSAISESGPTSMNFKFVPEAKTLAQSYAVALGCPDLSDEQCFQSKNTTQVLEATKVVNFPFSWSGKFDELYNYKDVWHTNLTSLSFIRRHSAMGSGGNWYSRV
jgi:carboxylesterase type B